jgi:beta-mannanase
MRRRHLLRVASAVALGVTLVATAKIQVAATSGKPAIPSNGSSYFGFTTRTWDELTDLRYGDERPFADRYADSIQNETAQKAPSLFGLPMIWQNRDGTMNEFNSLRWQLDAYHAFRRDSMPIIMWNAQTGWDVTSAGYAGITTRTVASGSLDGYIRTFADQVKAYRQPVFIRLICGEMNGSWWRNCSPSANSSLTPQNFIDAWRRVRKIFQQRGVTNVAWVWNVITFPPQGASWVDSKISGYYPGDSYVDWVGADHYDFGPSTWLDPVVAFGQTHSKPFFLAEWGVRHPSSTLTPQQEAAWIGEMFSYFFAHPSVKAILYFNYQAWPGAGDTILYGGLVNYLADAHDGDSRLVAESGAAIRSMHAGYIADSRYR